jgi:hypothetical protein
MHPPLWDWAWSAYARGVIAPNSAIWGRILLSFLPAALLCRAYCFLGAYKHAF